MPAKRNHREGKLAETAPKRPLALTIGAAAVTLLVILGVLSGPSIVTCFNSPDGMGQCLRGKMAEVGLVPAAPAQAVADTDTTSQETADTVEEAVADAPALDVTPPANPDVDQLVAATFGLLRAEPDGSVVIAGSGLPGSKVQVFGNGELLGTVEVEASGDWVFVPDNPLPPGGLEITLGEEGKSGTAPDSFIVVINDDKTSQPLVVASKPGEASEVLQGLTEPTQLAEATPPAPASAAPTPEAAPAQPETTTTTPPATPEVATAPAQTPSQPAPASAEPAPAAAPTTEQPPMQVAAAPKVTEPATAPAPEPAPTAVAPAANNTPAPAADATAPASQPSEAPMDVAQADTPVAPTPAQPSAPAAASPDEQGETPAEPAMAAPATEQPAPAAPAEAEPQAEATPALAPAPAATTAPAVTTPAPTQLAAVAPTIDAIEIETDHTFFAGAGPDGGIIRLYVDDAFVADATIDGGRWLVEAGPVLNKPSQRVRVDLLQPNSAEVIARAEVDFVVDVPEVDQPVAVADATTPPANQDEAPATPETPAASATPATPEAAPASAPVEAPAVPATEPASEPAATPATAAPAPSETAPATSEPAATPSETVAAPAEAQPSAPAEQPAPPATQPAEPAVPTMVAVSLGDPEAQRFVSGKAIIRRGDNLWTIARRVYGEGLKYTTIYQANTGQIRDPDRIYPGQVFDLPTEAPAQ